MANTIRLKRSSLAGKVPTAADLALGEIAVNTTDGKLYLKKSDGGEFIVEVGPVVSVAGRTGAVTLAKADVGLSNADNTADATKPISTAAQAALDGKAAAVHGHAIADVTSLQASLDAKRLHDIGFSAVWIAITSLGCIAGAAIFAIPIKPFGRTGRDGPLEARSAAFRRSDGLYARRTALGWRPARRRPPRPCCCRLSPRSTRMTISATRRGS